MRHCTSNKPALIGIFVCLAGIVAGCSTGSRISERDGVSRHHPPPPDIAAIPDAIPTDEPKSQYGNPSSYVVFGKRYNTLPHSRDYSARGIASWYGSKFHGQRTSSGEPYDMYAMTAAHTTLPLPSYAQVTNLKNNRSVVVKINDRGPFHDNRLIDLSYTAAWKLGIIDEGTGLVEVTAIDPNKPEPPTPISPVKPGEGRGLPELFLQVGAFGSPQNAQRLKQRLEEQLQADILIQDSDDSKHPVYRVQVGPIASVELADHLSQRLGQLGIRDPHVVIR
ncbi:MAG: septal ring lytic transglycosylase RlpA family protein [Candidatus Thiodiazotropha sp. (ex Epidulcina cf. delphinae)]|nr:septal ring lytic transglycosylase RlpA family protein [Candidatus Thiodiazotropha sp. (ex Epidulcina cf. delphinae)]